MSATFESICQVRKPTLSRQSLLETEEPYLFLNPKAKDEADITGASGALFSQMEVRKIPFFLLCLIVFFFCCLPFLIYSSSFLFFRLPFIRLLRGLVQPSAPRPSLISACAAWLRVKSHRYTLPTSPWRTCTWRPGFSTFRGTSILPVIRRSITRMGSTGPLSICLGGIPSPTYT